MVFDDELKAKQVSCLILVSVYRICVSNTKYSLQKQKEDLEEISTELELADDDDKVPYENRRYQTHFYSQTDKAQVQNWRFLLFSTSP